MNSLPLSVVQFLMKIYTPIKYKQEQLKKWMYSFIPMYIIQVLYIPEESSTISPLYNCSEYFAWSKQKNRVFPEGFYLFSFWDHDTQSIEKIILHSSHIKNALHITDFDYMWGYADDALIYILKNYIKTTSIRESMIDLSLNKKSVFKSLNSYKSSFEINKNITPRVLYLIHQCELNLPVNEKQEDYMCSYFTEELEERCSKLDEFLVK